MRAAVRGPPSSPPAPSCASPGEPLGPGEIYEANGAMLAAALEARRAGRAARAASPTTRTRTARALERGLEADVVVTSGGVSVGPHDLVRADRGASSASRRSSGASPSSRASRSRSASRARTLVFGLPGNPVSSLVGFELFVRPAVLALQGAAEPGPRYEPRSARGAVRRNAERDEFVRARPRARRRRDRARAADRPGVAHDRARRGADALVHVPRGEGELAAGSAVRVPPVS